MDNIATLLFDKSMAFLENAIVSSKAEKSEWFDTAEFSGVTAHLFHHAIELFLKSAIVASTKALPKNKHNIIELYKKYKQLYPSKEFDLEIPFKKEPEYMGFTEEQINQHKKDYPMSIELQLRYPVGWRGEVYSPTFRLETKYLEQCKQKLIELRRQIIPCEEI
jgi:HEPN domain-containing protein